MENYKIGYNGDAYVENIHHIGVEYNGNYYSVIFGEYVNGDSLVFRIGIAVVN